jgi:hypothetical protein
VQIVGIAGSPRAGSFNAALPRAAVEECPKQAALAIESIRGIPLYDGAVEAAQGIPARAAELKQRIAAAGGRPTGVQGARGGTDRRLARRLRYGAVASCVAKVFDASGRLADDAVRARLRKYMEGFAEFVAG